MSQSDDLEELARRYVDLWQDQMTALAADPEFAEAMQRVMATLGVSAAGLPAAWAAWPAAMGSMMAAAQPGTPPPGSSAGEGLAGGQEKDAGTAGSGNASKDGAGEPNGAAGSTPAASASDGGGDDLGVLAQRLAALEQRVLALEGGSGRTRRKAKAKPGR